MENIYISDIDMINIPAEPIRFNLFYGGQSPVLEDDQEAAIVDEQPAAVSEETPSFRDIYMKNIRAVGSGVAGYFQGLPEMNLKNIQLENAFLEGTKGITMVDADGIVFKNVTVKVSKGNPFTMYNVKNASISGLKSQSSATEVSLKIMGEKSEAIELVKSDFSDESKQLLIAENVKKKAVKVKK